METYQDIIQEKMIPHILASEHIYQINNFDNIKINITRKRKGYLNSVMYLNFYPLRNFAVIQLYSDQYDDKLIIEKLKS